MSTLGREGVPATTRFDVLRVLRNALNRAQSEEIVTLDVALNWATVQGQQAGAPALDSEGSNHVPALSNGTSAVWRQEPATVE